MVASRYDTQTAAPAPRDTINTTGGTTTGEGSTTTTGSGSTTGSRAGTGTTSETSRSQTQQQNMSGSSLAALELLIQQLLGGGTQDQANQRAQRMQEVDANRAARAGYSRDAAFGDAQGLMAQTMRQTLERLLPSIVRGSEGAGASQGSMRALLTQQAAQQAAEAASAQGLNAAVQYGNVSAGFNSILERLTQPDNSTTRSLLEALNVARGAVTSGSTTGSATRLTSSDETSRTNTNESRNTNTSENRTTTPLAPVSGSRVAGGQTASDLISFGSPTTGPALTAGTSVDFLEQLNNLAGNSSGWSSGFTF